MDKIATIIGNLLSIIFKYSATGWWYGKYWAVYRKWILNFLPNAAKTADIEPGLSMTIPENLHLEEHVHIGKKCVLCCFDEFRSEHGGVSL